MKTIKIKNILVTPIEPRKIKNGMLVLFNNQLLQVNGKDKGGYLLGTHTQTVAREPEFYPHNGKRVFQPVEIAEPVK